MEGWFGHFPIHFHSHCAASGALSAMAMMIGAHVGHVVLGRSTANAHRVLGEHVGALRERVRTIAAGVETSSR